MESRYPTKPRSVPDLRPRADVPAPGRTIAAAVEDRAVHVRRAVKALANQPLTEGLERWFFRVFEPQWRYGSLRAESEPLPLRAAWMIVNIWLLAQSTGNFDSNLELAEAEKWFRGKHGGYLGELSPLVIGSHAIEAHRNLANIPIDRSLWELLPYILDPYGPGTRMSVMRDPSTKVARDAKRKKGVYYTPADVAEYIVLETIRMAGRDPREVRCLDPACGTGVFLSAICRVVRKMTSSIEMADLFNYARDCLFGFDVSPLAVESCTFVLLHEVYRSALLQGLSPWAAWHTLRLNLVSVDALTVVLSDVIGRDHRAAKNRRSVIRQQLRAQHQMPPVIETFEASPVSVGLKESMKSRFSIKHFVPLAGILPEVENGFEVLVGNPPYSRIGIRDDFPLLQAQYDCIRNHPATGNEYVFPMFIEMMWRLTSRGSSAAGLVTPLSIAYHTGSQFRDCRSAMAMNGGHWRFAFFDREPHSLFGEDVKTRNSIIFRYENTGTPQHGKFASLETGPLRKWTSRTREKLFDGVRYTRIMVNSIDSGIPKLDGPEQAKAYATLMKRTEQLSNFCIRFRSCTPIEASCPNIGPAVFVGSTAYNFLNIYRCLAVNKEHIPVLSTNTVLCIELRDEALANVVFAILSSRLMFWLWHVRCDGFHVPQWFIEEIPFGRDILENAECCNELRTAGADLWQRVQGDRVVSINAGRVSYAYRPLAFGSALDSIDNALIQIAGLEEQFTDVLRSFVRSTVVIDETNGKRGRMRQFFST